MTFGFSPTNRCFSGARKTHAASPEGVHAEMLTAWPDKAPCEARHPERQARLYHEPQILE